MNSVVCDLELGSLLNLIKPGLRLLQNGPKDERNNNPKAWNLSIQVEGEPEERESLKSFPMVLKIWAAATEM